MHIVCSNCGQEQVVGNFCGTCGNKFEKVLLRTERNTTAKTSVQPVEPNIHIENLKQRSSIYRTYFIQQLKKPSFAFQQGEKDFSNGLFSIVLFTLLYTISLYLITHNNLRGDSLFFFPYFIQIILLTFLFFAISIFSLFIINSFFGSQYSLKAIISFYGGQLSPLVVTISLSLLLMIIQSFTFGNIMLVISFIITMFVLPLYLVSFLITKNPSEIDPLYGFILYIAVYVLLFVIIVTLLADSTLGRYLDNMIYLF
ncbi:hypothetical protein [Bacillus sp. FJAT-22090]|uniref:hypothetical protein n=1 Tax=Bacillus sp. FJAT-22090 TaxID=1581038 RepID=UPI00119D179E|nr:hypothetical protein [Bacillus sp. FJAT-22090]